MQSTDKISTRLRRKSRDVEPSWGLRRLGRCFRSADKCDERFAELSTHDAVDDEVDRVTEHDEEVHEDRDVTRRPVAHQRYIEGVLEDDDDQKSSERDLDQKHESYDDDQHHSSSGSITESDAVGC